MDTHKNLKANDNQLADEYYDLRKQGFRARTAYRCAHLKARIAFAARYIRDDTGAPWRVRDYQRESLQSHARRKIHCDGRDVGKTSEIEIIAAWAMANMPGKQMLVAAQTENHLFPLMHRLTRRFEETPEFAGAIVEIKRTPSWYLRFTNGFQLWGRISGPRGINFQGMHVDWQIVDEAQEMTGPSWGELFQALNGGGKRWIYGVPNGLRNGFYRMTQDKTAEQYNWPSTINPDYDDAKDEELARLYGGRKSPGYIHRVLGRHGEPAHGVFSLDDYAVCVDDGVDFESITLSGDETLHPPRPNAGDYYLGCDLGYARDPSELVVYKNDPPHIVNVLRVRLEGVQYNRQERVIQDLDAAYNFRAIGIDAGNNGRAVAHHLMSLGAEWCDKIHAFEFGSVMEAAELPDGTLARMKTKEFMTDLLKRRMGEKTIVFPRLPDRESEYAAHTYRINDAGHIVYDKGADHIIDADRCAVLAHHVDTQETQSKRPPIPFRIAFFKMNPRGGWLP